MDSTATSRLNIPGSSNKGEVEYLELFAHVLHDF